MELFPGNTMMPEITSANSATHMETDLISSLKNLAPATPFAPLCKEKLNALKKTCRNLPIPNYIKNQT